MVGPNTVPRACATRVVVVKAAVMGFAPDYFLKPCCFKLREV
jgi:hypothetical protein